MKIKLSDYLWGFIANKGVKDVFMFPGGGAMHLVDSIGKNEDIRNITLLHEQACAMAAETYSRITNTMGTILVTTGPGGTNAITGIAAAWMESTPMLVISGQVKTVDSKDGLGVRQLGTQEIGIVEIVKSITKYAVTVNDPTKIKYHLEKAFFEAYNGRPGPVWLDIPLDVQAAIIDTDNLSSFRRPNSTQSSNYLKEAVQKTLDCLINAQKPVIIVGQGIERNNGTEVFRRIVEYLQIPVLTSWMASELLPYNNKCNLGKPGMVAPRYSNRTVQKSDLIIAIGTRLDAAMIGYDPDDFAPEAKKIIVDIDKTELNKFKFFIEEKIEVDANDFLTELESQLQESLYDKKSKQPWLEECLLYKVKHPVLLPSFVQQEKLVNPYYFFDCLSDCLSDNDVIIPGSSGTTLDIFWISLKNKDGQRALSTGALGSMGYGIPAALGACIGSGKRTVCIEGDGSLQLNIQELANIKALNLPLKIFVLDNGGYLSIMNTQRTHFDGNLVGAGANSGLHLPNNLKVAEAYGLKTFEINDHKELKDKIKQVLNTEGPVLCNIVLGDNITVQPRVMSHVTENGGMVSGSLSKLWPFIKE